MPTIKFSHRYRKLVNGYDGNLIREAVLLAIFPMKLEEMGAAFRRWDTDDGVYQLPKKGSYLVLLFQKLGPGTTNSHLFTTIRRATPEKLMYYEDHIGQTFIVDINREPLDRSGVK